MKIHVDIEAERRRSFNFSRSIWIYPDFFGAVIGVSFEY
jgi:hypothetical protein